MHPGAPALDLDRPLAVMRVLSALYKPHSDLRLLQLLAVEKGDGPHLTLPWENRRGQARQTPHQVSFHPRHFHETVDANISCR